MGLESHPVRAEMSPDGWILLWGAVDGVSSGLYGPGQAWLGPFHTEGPWRSLSSTSRLSGYRTFTSVLLFLPSVNLVVQRAVFSKTVILMASLGGKEIYMCSLLTDWLIDWAHICKAPSRSSFPHVMHMYTTADLESGQQCRSWDGLLSPTLPQLQEPSAPSSAPHAVCRSHSEPWSSLGLVWCSGLQCSLCPLYECSGGRGESCLSWVAEDMGQQTTWICLWNSVSCFRTLIATPDTFPCVILYLILAWRAWGGSYCNALCL